MLVNVNNQSYDLIVQKKETKGVYVISLSQNEQMASKICFGIENENDKNRVWLYRISTDDNYKKNGLGTKLIQTMEYIALQNNITHIDGYYYPEDDVVASMFYGYKFNFENASGHIYKDLNAIPNNELIEAIKNNKQKEESVEL